MNSLHRYLDVLIEVFLVFSLPNLFNGVAHFLGGPLDQQEEGLDVDVAHHLHVQGLVDELDVFDADVGAIADGLGAALPEQQSQELTPNQPTQLTMELSPSFFSSSSIILATVLAWSWDLNS